MDVKLTPEAHNDIRSIYEYVKKDGEQIARSQVSAIYESLERLGEFPEMGVALQNRVKRKTDLRYLVINKVYVAVYKVSEAVDIIRIFRKEQDFISVLNLD